MGRRVVAAVAVTLVLALIARDGAVIQAAVFDVPDVALPDRDCEAGVTRLRGAYTPLWAQIRDDGAAPSLLPLDLQLRALRPRCEREGEAPLARFTQLERWRYRAENQARLWHDTLSPDSAGATSAPGSPGANP
jgi:hypothetical protein